VCHLHLFRIAVGRQERRRQRGDLDVAAGEVERRQEPIIEVADGRLFGEDRPLDGVAGVESRAGELDGEVDPCIEAIRKEEALETHRTRGESSCQISENNSS
jgi:hypothetical protein